MVVEILQLPIPFGINSFENVSVCVDEEYWDPHTCDGSIEVENSLPFHSDYQPFSFPGQAQIGSLRSPSIPQLCPEIIPFQFSCGNGCAFDFTQRICCYSSVSEDNPEFDCNEYQAPLEILSIVTNESESGEMDGAISITIYNEQAPLVYEWKNLTHHHQLYLVIKKMLIT